MALIIRIVKAASTTTNVCTDDSLDHVDFTNVTQLTASHRVSFAVNMNFPDQPPDKRLLVNLTGGEMTFVISAVIPGVVGNLADILDKLYGFVSYKVTDSRTLCIKDDSGNVIKYYPGRLSEMTADVRGGQDVIVVNMKFVVSSD